MNVQARADERPVIFATGVGERGVLAGDDGAAATNAPAPSTRPTQAGHLTERAETGETSKPIRVR